MTLVPNRIYRFNLIPIKLPMALFTKLEQKFTIHMETQRILNSKNSLEKNGAGGLKLPDFRLILQSYSHQDGVVLTQK